MRAGLKQIRAYVGGLQLHGGTAIFTAMQRLPAGRRRRAAFKEIHGSQ